jgi:hypothetical protein
MKRLIFVTLFAMIAVGATAWGQDCGNWTNNDLRGTYAMSGSGTIDPSLLLPGMGIPAGSVSGFYVGAFTLDGRGVGTAGWVSANTGGSQFSFQMVGIKYSMQPHCSVQIELHVEDQGFRCAVHGPARGSRYDEAERPGTSHESRRRQPWQAAGFRV